MPDPTAETRPITIRRWTDIADQHSLGDEIDAVFYEASNTKSFASDADRAAFRERWLGRYLTQYPDHAFVALAEDGRVAGYLVGAIGEPSSFSAFAEVNEHFPAHLHVNLAPRYRSLGIGAALIDAFAIDAARAGAPGMHVVTSADARNVRFYERRGFTEQARTQVGGRDLVFLGRRLTGEAS
jgi:GNAT superfamily N-acetyltransferase